MFSACLINYHYCLFLWKFWKYNPFSIWLPQAHCLTPANSPIACEKQSSQWCVLLTFVMQPVSSIHCIQGCKSLSCLVKACITNQNCTQVKNCVHFVCNFEYSQKNPPVLQVQKNANILLHIIPILNASQKKGIFFSFNWSLPYNNS